VTFATKPFQHNRSVIHFVTIIISPAPNHTSEAVIYPPFKTFSNRCEGTGEGTYGEREARSTQIKRVLAKNGLESIIMSGRLVVGCGRCSGKKMV
jgi:hypothetical protein